MLFFFLGLFSITQATEELYDYPIIGIDLGTTYSSVCIFRDDKVEIIPNEYGFKSTPTVVAFNGTFLIGEEAKEQGIINPQNTFYDIKRLTGRTYLDPNVNRVKKGLPFTIMQENDKICIKVSQPRNKSNKIFNIDYIQAKVLTKLKNIASSYLGVPVKNAVISIPIGFNDIQKQATIDIAEIAGLKVVRLISEPNAAVIAYGRDYVTEKTNIFVFDFGGGTLDIAATIVTKQKFEEIDNSSEMNLGGEDFDFNVVKYLVDQIYNSTGMNLTDHKKANQALKIEAQKAKETLSSQEIAHIRISNLIEGYDFQYNLTREKFEEVNQDLFDRVISTINSTFIVSETQIEDIDEVILVGGSSRIPKVQEIVEKRFVHSKIIKDRIQDELVCIGAAILANSLTKQLEKQYRFVEIKRTAISYGVETDKEDMNIIIPRLSRYPLVLSRFYTTIEDYQTGISINIFQGESEFTEYNEKIGNFKLSGIQKATKGVPEIEITFALNQNGMLTATAFDLNTKSSSQLAIQIKNKKRLTQEDIDNLRKENEQEEKLDREKIQTISKLKKYHMQFLNDIKKSKYKYALGESQLYEIKEILNTSSKWLEDNRYKLQTTTQDFQNELQNLKNSLDKILNRQQLRDSNQDL
ncbi:unnamed protein product (macronuclear) [Paramecium tetraurelia]|uniref:Heat shock protein 70 n=1 Tax=Paramecium tetraurelia TaxID=5888 RepID=A0CCS3_PARTE|nr:uncharacterized protein GSPATT00037375001 [Paramecium tetraurelia]CAK68590.1 unnamed protein product [Paramecium tetraurelia]|eukprot:XP_001435987.1 hypothetical protein (macronuclear) [Paramecium tetraurelia strain d4-2]